jgi:cytochrome c-type biogenesis protein CcmH
MIERYGDFVLYRPRLTASNFLLWAAPALLLLVGGALLLRVVRRRAQETDIDPEGPEAGQS